MRDNSAGVARTARPVPQDTERWMSLVRASARAAAIDSFSVDHQESKMLASHHALLRSGVRILERRWSHDMGDKNTRRFEGTVKECVQFLNALCIQLVTSQPMTDQRIKLVHTVHVPCITLHQRNLLLQFPGVSIGTGQG